MKYKTERKIKYSVLRERGSQIAKGGFRNEEDIINKFNAWQEDLDAKEWLKIMQYDVDEIEYVKAVKVSGEKTDVQVQVTIKLKEVIDVENLQVKLVSNPKGFNQIDKRWIDNYLFLWDIPDDIVNLLKLFTGEIAPSIKTKDKRRMFANEFIQEDQKKLLDFLKSNKTLIISDILKGRGIFSAEWMLVVKKVDYCSEWVLKPMNFVVNYFGNGEVVISKRGSFHIGKITVQRKGGDAGRDTAKMLQFKINPAELFEV